MIVATGVRSGERITTTRAFQLVTEIVGEVPARFGPALLTEMRRFEPRLLALIKSGVPVRSGPRPAKFARSRPGLRPAGGLRSLLTTAINEKELRLSGGLLTSQAAQAGFYGFILDVGRGNKRGVSRKRSRTLYRAPGSKGFKESIRYTRRISPIAPEKYDITFGRVRIKARDEGGPMLLRAYDKVLGEILWSGRA